MDTRNAAKPQVNYDDLPVTYEASDAGAQLQVCMYEHDGKHARAILAEAVRRGIDVAEVAIVLARWDAMKARTLARARDDGMTDEFMRVMAAHCPQQDERVDEPG